jgi:hypothetical protein
MEIFWIVVISVLVIFFIARGKGAHKANADSTQIAPKTKRPSDANAASDNGIPSGYQIWVARPDVAGLLHKKKEAVAFAKAKQQTLLLEREPDNTHDSNAIKLIGLGDGKQFFVGYVPKEISEQIAATNMFEHVRARLRKTYLSERNYVDIEYQIIGPKSLKKIFETYHSNKPMTESQKDYFSFFELQLSKDLTCGAADTQIAEHKKTVSEDELKEWDAYQHILNEFNDADFRDSYDLKKVSKTVLLSALKELRANGNSYVFLDQNIDDVVDKVVEMKPDLEKSS